jgi:hypothetical protein
MTPYQKEQIECFDLVQEHLTNLTEDKRMSLRELMGDYLRYRRELAEFLNENLSDVCNEKCFRGHLSACCSKDGIITFFADVVINSLFSKDEALKELRESLLIHHEGFKCVYLGNVGCLWKIKPIVCEMFLCDAAKESAFRDNLCAKEKWEELIEKKKAFTWPDRPVLFDKIEEIFIQAGCSSPLMYLHNSPGLLRVKENSYKRKQGG